jgi:hypothetical protein
MGHTSVSGFTVALYKPLCLRHTWYSLSIPHCKDSPAGNFPTLTAILVYVPVYYVQPVVRTTNSNSSFPLDTALLLYDIIQAQHNTWFGLFLQAIIRSDYKNIQVYHVCYIIFSAHIECNLINMVYIILIRSYAGLKKQAETCCLCSLYNVAQH